MSSEPQDLETTTHILIDNYKNEARRCKRKKRIWAIISLISAAFVVFYGYRSLRYNYTQDKSQAAQIVRSEQENPYLPYSLLGTVALGLSGGMYASYLMEERRHNRDIQSLRRVG